LETLNPDIFSDIVAAGSSLDVAAIQQDNPKELDYNKELRTVGISNIVAGLSGAGKFAQHHMMTCTRRTCIV
jgi:MFS superfamily sulfate permease-like transporter